MNFIKVFKKGQSPSCRRFILAAALVLACMSSIFVATSAQASSFETIIGNTSLGTRYYIYQPTSWNGTLILDLDGDRWESRYLHSP